MNRGDLTAHDIVTGRAIRVLWQHDRILDVLPANQSVPPGRWIAPALVDLQVNGYGGIDFQQDALPLSALVTARRQLALAGCTRWLLTLITDDWARLMGRLRHLRALRDRSAELRHAIPGWHIEGPFLSAEPGFRGAHDGDAMIDPTEAHLRELRDATGNDPVLLTLAPERPGAIEAIRAAVALGFTVSLGHTDAPADVLEAAIAAGARAFTHLGNGCPRTLDRHDNILWRVLDAVGLPDSKAVAGSAEEAQPRLRIGLIPDAIHVSPALFRLIHRLVAPDGLFYVTDAMSAAGGKPGRYPLGKLELEVGPDQVVRLPGQPNFAGSALRPVDGVTRAARMLGRSWRDVWPAFAAAPSALIGLPTGLVSGAPADFCVVTTNPRGEIRTLTSYAAGAEVTAG